MLHAKEHPIYKEKLMNFVPKELKEKKQDKDSD